MIEINLLPEELRSVAGNKKFSLSSIEPRNFLYLVPFALGVILFLHIYLFVTSSVASLQFNALNKKWNKLGDQRKIVESEIKRNASILQDSALLQRLSNVRLSWAGKLTQISTGVPAGIWLTEISLAADGATLRGSAVSFEKQEVNLINKFIDNLKANEGFIKDFSGIELNSVQKKLIGGYEVVDFTLLTNFLHKENAPNAK